MPQRPPCMPHPLCGQKWRRCRGSHPTTANRRGYGGLIHGIASRPKAAPKPAAAASAAQQ